MSGVFRAKCADLSRPGGLSRFDSRGQLVEELRQQLGRWGAAADEEATVFSCGAAAVDRLLPGGGLRHGMLVEWVGGGVAAGGSPAEKLTIKTKRTRPVRATGEPPVATSSAVTLGLLAAREACREGGVLVVIDRSQTFYPPAAAVWGVDLERLIVVRPQDARDELWAAVQALRSPVVAALWARIDRLESRAFRRLQLAAEAGRTLGALVRPPAARGQSSWADVRFEVESRAKSQETRARPPALDSRLLTLDSHRRVQVRVLHCHSDRAGGAAMLEIDDVARTVQQMSPRNVPHPLPVVAELGGSASRSLPARA